MGKFIVNQQSKINNQKLLGLKTTSRQPATIRFQYARRVRVAVA